MLAGKCMLAGCVEVALQHIELHSANAARLQACGEVDLQLLHWQLDGHYEALQPLFQHSSGNCWSYGRLQINSTQHVAGCTIKVHLNH